MAINDYRALFVYDSQSDRGVLAGGSWLTDLPLANTQVTRPEIIARSANTALTSTRFRLTLRSPMSVAMIFVGWTNLSSDARIRTRIWPDDTFDGTPSYDSDWVEDLIPDDVDTDRRPSLFLLLDDTSSAQFMSVEIDDINNPYGYVDIGRIKVGRHLKMPMNFGFGGNGLSLLSSALVASTPIGGEWVSDLAERRSWKASFDAIDETDLYGDIFTMIRTVKRGGEVIVVPRPDASPTELQRRSFLGHFIARDAISQNAFRRGGFGIEVTEVMGLAPAALAGTYRIELARGIFAMTGNELDLRRSAEVFSLDRGALVLTGGSLGVIYQSRLPADLATFDVTGGDLGFARAVRIAPEAGAFVLTGNDATLRFGFGVALGAGEFVLTGNDASLVVRRLDLAQGDFVLTGNDLSMKRSYRGSLSAGSFEVTGNDVDMSAGVRMLMSSGSFAFTGQSVGVAKASKLLLSSATFSLTGQSVGMHVNAPLGAGEFIVSGQAVNLAAAKKLAIGAGAFTLTGQNATIRKSSKIVLGGASFALAGQDIEMRNYSLRVLAGDEAGNRRVLAGDEAGNLRRTTN